MGDSKMLLIDGSVMEGVSTSNFEYFKANCKLFHWFYRVREGKFCGWQFHWAHYSRNQWKLSKFELDEKSRALPHNIWMVITHEVMNNKLIWKKKSPKLRYVWSYLRSYSFNRIPLKVQFIQMYYSYSQALNWRGRFAEPQLRDWPSDPLRLNSVRIN